MRFVAAWILLAILLAGAPGNPAQAQAPAWTCANADSTAPTAAHVLGAAAAGGLRRVSVISADSMIVPDGGRVRFLMPLVDMKPEQTRLFAVYARANRPDDARPLLPSDLEVNEGKLYFRLMLPRLGGLELFPEVDITVLACVRPAPDRAYIGYAAGQGTLSVATRWPALVAAVAVPFLALVLAGSIAWRWRGKRRQEVPISRIVNLVWITRDSLGYASVSRLQMLFFTLVTLSLLSYIGMRTGFPPDVSSDVIVLMGIAAGGSVAAGLVGSTRAGLNPQNIAWLRKREWLREVADPHWSQLVMHKGTLDIYRLQSVVFSLVVALSLLQTGFYLLAFYDVPDGIMTLLGISQGTYVGGKLVEQAQALRAADEAVSRAREADIRWQAELGSARAADPETAPATASAVHALPPTHPIRVAYFAALDAIDAARLELERALDDFESDRVDPAPRMPPVRTAPVQG
jgi:hypothetical protein